MTDGEANDETMLKRYTTGEDRVRMVARQLTEPRTANWIAEEADWSHEPTKRVLERLVDDGVLLRDDAGPHVTYYPDYRQQAMREATLLRDNESSVETLTDRLGSMKSKIRGWKAEFDVDSPNQLRATITRNDLTPEAESHRRDVAREWERLDRRIEIVGFAIREWDFLTPGDEPVEASN
jgi:DNA-binding Lrp family transcriptional regulator